MYIGKQITLAMYLQINCLLNDDVYSGSYYISKATMLLLSCNSSGNGVARCREKYGASRIFDIGIHSPTFSRKKTIAPKKFAFVRVKNVKSCFLPFDQEL